MEQAYCFQSEYLGIHYRVEDLLCVEWVFVKMAVVLEADFSLRGEA